MADLALTKLAANGGSEPGEAVFHDEIVRAGFHGGHGLLVHDSGGDHQEREVHVALLHHVQGFGEREARHGIVRYDHVPLGVIERGSEAGSGIHALVKRRKAAAPQLHHQQVGIFFGVLDDQNSQGFALRREFRYWAHVVPLVCKVK